VTEKVHEEMGKRAKEKNFTLKEYVEFLLVNDKTTKEGK
jgi:hypothetical protein